MKLLISVLSTVMFVMATSNVVPPRTSPGNGVHEDFFIAGSLGQRIFYGILQTLGVNWTDARLGCQKRNMKLLEILTNAEFQSLKDTYDAEDKRFPCCMYWVGARDSQSLDQFSWDTSTDVVSNSQLDLDGEVALKNCLYLNIDSGAFVPASCNNLTSRAYLCEHEL